MGIKYDRNYSLFISRNSNPSEFLNIRRPFTLEFDITRNTLTSANVCKIRIYNLGLKNRNEILKDQFDSNINKQVILHAGYGDVPSFPLIFSGNITRAWSFREGKNNFISTIEAFDGGNAFVNARTNPNLSWPAGTTYQTIIEQLVDSLSVFGIKRGNIGTFPGSISRGYSPETGVVDTLVRLTGGAFFIDNGIANCLQSNEVFQDEQIQVISSASGLLGTPIREQTLLTFEMLFEPNIRMGQVVKLDSITGANYNAQYKVVAIQHKGMISDAVCGDAITKVTVFYTPTPAVVPR